MLHSWPSKSPRMWKIFLRINHHDQKGLKLEIISKSFSEDRSPEVALLFVIHHIVHPVKVIPGERFYLVKHFLRASHLSFLSMAAARSLVI